MRKDRWKDGKLNYQVRVMVIWIEKLEMVGTGALNSIKGRSCATIRMILFDMANIGMIKGMDQRTSKSPVKEVSSDIRTLRDGDGNRRGVIRVFRHTIGRRYSCQW